MYEDTESPSRGSPTGSPPQSLVDEDEVKILEQEDLASQVYQDIWRKFYTWEHDSYARQFLQELSRCLPALPPPPWMNQHTRSQHHVSTGRSNENDEFEFEVHDFEPHHVAFNLKQKHRPIRVPEIPFYPRYTTCTPISQSIGNANSHALAHTLNFIPFADDPKFEPRMRRLLKFTSLDWVTDFKDPDVEIIQLETARRLHFAHGFTFPEIDRLSFLLGCLRSSSRSGIIWESQQRDPLSWPELWRDQNQTLPIHHITSTSLAEHVQTGAPTFCSNLNCIHDFCNVHKEGQGKSKLPLRQPTLDIDHMWSDEELRKPCRNQCYKTTVREEIDEDELNWAPSEYENFRGIIALVPDAMPCELAVICRKDCTKVYQARRLWLLNDTEIEVPRKEILTADDARKFESTGQEGRILEAIIGGCSHVGPCNQYADCDCFKTGSNCHKSCRCSEGCKIRLSGCDCHKKAKGAAKMCVDKETCSCLKMGRECNPELCLPREPTSQKPSCRNSLLQKGRFPDIQVSPSQWGLGAFALNRIEAFEIIGAYYGEFYLTTAGPPSCLIPMQIFTGYNYSFDLDNANRIKRDSENDRAPANVDSWYAGNVTRYLNHPPSGTLPNCYASQSNVNGVETVYIHTVRDIQPGEELYLDYGLAYWSAKNNKDDSESEGTVEEEGMEEESEG